MLDEVLPDLLAAAEDGVRYRRLTRQSVRPEFVEALEQLRKVVWRDVLGESPASPADDGTAGPEAVTMLSVQTLAQMTGLDPSGIRRKCQRGKLQGRKVRGQWMVEGRDAERWIESRTR
jgi:hypothetical protein